ncbi:hypothetical protein [Streptomyces sp. NBC_01431]|uniref:hypothetical protein n=1 Tax=Streptomyces sp. NBC_01431 TaxID=2903863 RepID=UPI002E309A8C|nr:hypothetical protein [Streptomyces sp. NBC_01431]
MHEWAQGWRGDALAAGADTLIAAGLLIAAVTLQVRWLAGLSGVWAILALRQSWLTVRARRTR